MIIERIISLANRHVKLQFTAMERSLRAAGCDLPLEVIPFDDDLFDLPSNARWLRDEELFRVVAEAGAVQMCRKYLALTQERCAYFDADIVHLQDPREALRNLRGDVFAVADTEWNKNRWTFTPETQSVYVAKSTVWALSNFNAGFFGYEKAPVRKSDVFEFLIDSKYGRIARGNSPTASDQEGANFLVHRSGAAVVNLCLPPYGLESTMACDYPRVYEPLLAKDNAPPFIHYAGPGGDLEAPIARLISQYLTKDEAMELRQGFVARKRIEERVSQWPVWARIVKRIIPKLDRRFKLEWAG